MVEIEIESKKWSGSTSTKFSSKGFTKGACDPRQPVSFGGGRDDGTSEGGGGDDGSGGAKKSKKKKRRTDEDQPEGEPAE